MGNKSDDGAAVPVWFGWFLAAGLAGCAVSLWSKWWAILRKLIMRKASARFDNDKKRRTDGHDRQRMLTPSYVLEPIRELLGGIDLDPCTESDNPTKASEFYCLPEDGCIASWGEAKTVFCNPPYGMAKGRWVARCIEEGRHRNVILLIPSHTETRVFQRAMKECDSVLFVKSRLRFGVVRENGRQEAASHGSAIFGFNADVSKLAEKVSGIPVVMGSVLTIL